MTAVEWLEEQLNKIFISNEIQQTKHLFYQAIEMEKQQIENAFNAGVNSEDFFYPSTGKLECEIYYEETYKK